MNDSTNTVFLVPFQPTNTLQVDQQINIPSFISKLWKLVEDAAYDNWIRWDEAGYSFHITDGNDFSKQVLPQYFKHNNLNSFIRQLNMYGFHKVTNIEQGGLIIHNVDRYEFQHSCFLKGHPELLPLIQRKPIAARQDNPPSSQSLKSTTTKIPLESILQELKALRDKQASMNSKLGDMKQENATLWHELSEMRKTHVRQQQVVNKLMQFLLSVVKPMTGSKKARIGDKRSLLALDEAADPKQTKLDQNGQQNDAFMVHDSQNSIDSFLSHLSDTDREKLSDKLTSIANGLAFDAENVHEPEVSDNGPLISDVTDEPTTSHLVAQPHLNSSDNSPISSDRYFSTISPVGDDDASAFEFVPKKASVGQELNTPLPFPSPPSFTNSKNDEFLSSVNNSDSWSVGEFPDGGRLRFDSQNGFGEYIDSIGDNLGDLQDILGDHIQDTGYENTFKSLFDELPAVNQSISREPVDILAQATQSILDSPKRLSVTPSTTRGPAVTLPPQVLQLPSSTVSNVVSTRPELPVMIYPKKK